MPAIERKHVRRVSPLFVVFGLVFLFAAYNLLHMVMHNKGPNPGAAVTDALGMSDPVTGLRYHVAVTATDAPYSQWQCRIMYYWYKKVRDMPGSDMGNFTRILHSGRTDHLMEEMHTFVVDPLPDGLDRGYIVLNRPWAFVQWLESATIEEEYILMAEPDHIFVSPFPNLAKGSHPAGYPFFYIKPAEKAKIIRKFYPKEKGPLTDIDPIGNSPVIIQKVGSKKESLLTENH